MAEKTTGLEGKVIFDEDQVDSVLSGLILKIEKKLEEEGIDPNNVYVVGIKSGGVDLARRFAEYLGATDYFRENRQTPVKFGSIDCSYERDDPDNFKVKGRGSDIINDLNGKYVFLVDEVSATRRTALAAINFLTYYWRPAKVSFVALVDRGGAELPIQPDFTGLTIPGNRDTGIIKYKDRKLLVLQR